MQLQNTHSRTGDRCSGFEHTIGKNRTQKGMNQFGYEVELYLLGNFAEYDLVFGVTVYSFNKAF